MKRHSICNRTWQRNKEWVYLMDLTSWQLCKWTEEILVDLYILWSPSRWECCQHWLLKEPSHSKPKGFCSSYSFLLLNYSNQRFLWQWLTFLCEARWRNHRWPYLNLDSEWGNLKREPSCCSCCVEDKISVWWEQVGLNRRHLTSDRILIGRTRLEFLRRSGQ